MPFCCLFNGTRLRNGSFGFVVDCRYQLKVILPVVIEKIIYIPKEEFCAFVTERNGYCSDGVDYCFEYFVVYKEIKSRKKDFRRFVDIERHLAGSRLCRAVQTAVSKDRQRIFSHRN